MTGKHHLIAGGITGACVATSAILSGNVNYLVIGGTILTTMIGSLFPDIDTRTSKLGKKMKITSTIISKMFGHRGFLHSPIFIVLTICALSYIFNSNNIQQFSLLWQGFAIGMINHLVCDMMTKGGVPILYPFNKVKVSFTFMRSGSKWECIPLSIVCALTIIATVFFCSAGTFL